MKWLKLILVIAFAVIFIGTTFTAIFGAGRVLGQVLKVYVFKYEECEYKPVPMRQPVELEVNSTFPERSCDVDYNRAKRDISDGLAMFIVAFPVAWISQKSLRRYIKESKE